MRSLVCVLLLMTSVVLIVACDSNIESDTPVFVQLFAASKDKPNETALYAVFSDVSIEKISAQMIIGGNVVDVVVSPDAKHVAYIADQEIDTQYELYVVAVEGGEITKVSGQFVVGGGINEPLKKSHLFWSPDSTKIAYIARQDDNQVVELYVSAADGSSNIKVSGPQIAGTTGVKAAISWSPDSSMIAYASEQSLLGILEIYVSTSDGLSNSKVSGTMALGGAAIVSPPLQLAWSPDNKFIAYLATQQNNVITELFISTADGLTNTKVSGDMIAGGNVSLLTPLWSPDSSRIAYLADQDVNGEIELFASSPDGLVKTQLSAAFVAGGSIKVDFVFNDPGNINAGVVESTDVQWSPDGQSILYIADQQVQARDEVFVSSLDGMSNVRVSADLITGGSVSRATWSPDGSLIAYGAFQNALNSAQLFITPVDGTTNAEIDNVAPLNVPIGSLHWSPDSSKIAYIYAASNPFNSANLQIANIKNKTSIFVSGTLSSPLLSSLFFPDNDAVKWSADSNLLTYKASDTSVGIAELYSIQADSGLIENVSGELVKDGFVNAFF